MVFKKKVQFLSLGDDELKKYSFLDLESNLPFDVYSTAYIPSYKDLKPYQVYDLDFQLIRVNDSKKGLCWKIRGV